ncbi:ubiquitin-like-specific protease 2 [Blastomyces dermatitidis ER-3]|nr:ubiquitin-like-specific protease 2 [Blastomyces dermatitidis ER-3]EEQ84941.2 ubiquitin-like-specific protease 2 [Blastomyces dermatitidis ER-3]
MIGNLMTLHRLERSDPEEAKKVYFFQFIVLYQLNKGLSDCVKMDTGCVDIFSYNYIVVPINENIHWYMAIICNLPNSTDETTSPVDVSSTKENEEGKSKRSLIINSKNIEGMAAKGIPQQSNTFNCGLYLLAYLEKSIQNPGDFVTKLLHKRTNEDVDRSMLRSDLFRQRLQVVLPALYKEQDGEDGMDAERLLIVDTEPLNNILLCG